jgi:hypothetical protein
LAPFVNMARNPINNRRRHADELASKRTVHIASLPTPESGRARTCVVDIVERLQERRDEAGIATPCSTASRPGSSTRAFYSAAVGEPSAIARTLNERPRRNIAFARGAAFAGHRNLGGVFGATSGFSGRKSDSHV